MNETIAIGECVRRIRAGDEEAAATLVRLYEPAIRRAVRLHLNDRGLRRLFDSMDICQSVMASFFVRAAAGQYELERPEQLVRLLTTMARNKLASEARRQYRQRRNVRRCLAGPEAMAEVKSTEPSPSRVLSGKERLELLLDRLDERARRLAELRAAGLSWAEIAARLGSTPERAPDASRPGRGAGRGRVGGRWRLRR